MTTRDFNPNHPREGRARRFVKWVVTSLVGLLVVAVATVGVFYVATPIPNPNKDFATSNTHLLFADGKTELGTLSVQNREVIAYEQMPENVKQAIVAAENPTFWRDPGIDPRGIARALTTLTDGAGAQGGSTITQQYVKVLYLSQERTLWRKLKELVIALKVGQEQTKEEILAGYLNTVYYGRGAYGLSAAAKAYFDVNDPSTLTLQQAVVLASVINAPGKMDPAQGPEAAQTLFERYQYTLNRMVDTGVLTASERAKIYNSLPAFGKNEKDARYGGTNGYLMKMVEAELKALGFDESEITGGGLVVTTTFDKAKQDAAVAAGKKKVAEAAAEKDADPAKLHASVASIDNATGGVLALYAGNNDYPSATRNWATTAAPSGSTFKTWALVAALRQGVTLDQTFKGYTHTAADGAQVSGHKNTGMITLQEATTTSNNAAYVDLTSSLDDGGAATIKAAQDAGLPGVSGKLGWKPDLRVAMGTAEVAPLDMASAYSTLANDGEHVRWHVVREVKDSTGRVVFTAEPKRRPALEKEIATTVTRALEEVTESGTGDVVGALDWPVAGKTGTRYDGEGTRASWFVGYTKQITTAVNFRAGDSGNENLDDYSDGFYGSGYPAETWLAYMTQAMDGLPREKFTGSTYEPDRPAAPAPVQTPTRSLATPTATRPSATNRTPTAAASASARPTSTPTTRTTRPSASPTASRATMSRTAARPSQTARPRTAAPATP